MKWTVTLPFEPVAKRAHTAARAGNNVWVVDPDKAVKNDIAQTILHMFPLPDLPFSGPLRAVFEFRFQIPHSLSAKESKRRHAQYWAAEVRKDLDNCVKLYQDSLNTGDLKGRILADDHWICDLVAKKTWSEIGSIRIELESLGSETEDFF